MVIWGRDKVGQGRMVEESSPVLPHPTPCYTRFSYPVLPSPTSYNDILPRPTLDLPALLPCPTLSYLDWVGLVA